MNRKQRRAAVYGTPNPYREVIWAGRCSLCGSVAVEEINHPKAGSTDDVYFYCQNKDCANHDGVGLGDQDPSPEWCVSGERQSER